MVECSQCGRNFPVSAPWHQRSRRSRSGRNRRTSASCRRCTSCRIPPRWLCCTCHNYPHSDTSIHIERPRMHGQRPYTPPDMRLAWAPKRETAWRVENEKSWKCTPEIRIGIIKSRCDALSNGHCPSPEFCTFIFQRPKVRRLNQRRYASNWILISSAHEKIGVWTA